MGNAATVAPDKSSAKTGQSGSVAEARLRTHRPGKTASCAPRLKPSECPRSGCSSRNRALRNSSNNSIAGLLRSRSTARLSTQSLLPPVGDTHLEFEPRRTVRRAVGCGVPSDSYKRRSGRKRKRFQVHFHMREVSVIPRHSLAVGRAQARRTVGVPDRPAA